jgi:hypothetical protein
MIMPVSSRTRNAGFSNPLKDSLPDKARLTDVYRLRETNYDGKKNSENLAMDTT